MTEKIGVIGLGYVGLPLALALSKHFPGTVGFDVNHHKIAAISAGLDPTDEGLEGLIHESSLAVTANPADLKDVTFFIVGVPTPIDKRNQPDLNPLASACEIVGSCLKVGDVVVFESTVYPGLTEEVCGPLLASQSGLNMSEDFWLGYSPERINPGDVNHTLQDVVKIVAGDTPKTLSRIAAVYGKIVRAGLHHAPSIRVAEAAKVIENAQRDLNIAFMNELAVIFDRMGISTKEVLAAAGTKWNFLPFTPGLVGGHCIGVDPYYLTAKAQELGYHPQIILAGRRINDEMGIFIAQRLIKILCQNQVSVAGARVGVLGVTFKENVSDPRNSRVPDIIGELQSCGVNTLVHDPLVNPGHCHEEYGIYIVPRDALTELDALVYAVPHNQFNSLDMAEIRSMVRPGGVVIDVKSRLDADLVKKEFTYWSL